MQIVIAATPDERFWLEVLNALGRKNARIYRANPELPGLYESGVRYFRRDGELVCEVERLRYGAQAPVCDPTRKRELWADVFHAYALKREDCDGLSAIRMGELLARGTSALSRADGAAYRFARREGGRRRVQAQVFLRTRLPAGRTGGLYHCLTRYRIVGRRRLSPWYVDDPSARLGMNGGSPEARDGLAGVRMPSPADLYSHHRRLAA